MSTQRPVLYLFIGYPGAGKTTVARLIHQASGAVHLWGDFERQQMFDQPNLSHDESQALYARLNDQADRLLAAGQSVIFDANFNFRKDRDHLRSIAARHGADTLILWLTTPRKLAFQRAHEHGERIVFGNMSQASFDRVADQLEPPDKDEKVLKFDGTKLDAQALLRDLGL